jgi:hypothetical protein
MHKGGTFGIHYRDGGDPMTKFVTVISILLGAKKTTNIDMAAFCTGKERMNRYE